MFKSSLLFLFVAWVIAQNTDNDNSNTDLATRLSFVTFTTTNVGTIVTTDVGTSRFITSLPPSLSTYTTQIPLSTTLVPVLTPSVISGRTVVTTNTAGQVMTTVTGGTTVTPASSATSSAGADAIGADRFVPGLVGAAALGVVALL